MSKTRGTLLCGAFAFTTVLALPGCDTEPDDRPSVIAPRSGIHNCEYGYVTAQSGSFTYNTTPDPDGDPDDPDGPLLRRQVDEIVHNSNQVFAVSFANTEAAQTCHEVCAREELKWSGRGCVVEFDYDFGALEYFNYEDGTLAVQVEVEAEVQPGCDCAG